MQILIMMEVTIGTLHQMKLVAISNQVFSMFGNQQPLALLEMLLLLAQE